MRRPPAIAVKRVRKAYGATVALDDASFSIRARHGARAARRERRGQVHDRQAAVWSGQPDAAESASSASRRRFDSPRDAQPRRPDGVPGNDPGPRPHRAHNMLLPSGRPATSAVSAGGAAESCGRRSSRVARPRRYRISTTKSAASTCRCGRRSRSPARSSASRASCCSTSRHRRLSGRDIDWLGALITDIKRQGRDDRLHLAPYAGSARILRLPDRPAQRQGTSRTGACRGYHDDEVIGMIIGRSLAQAFPPRAERLRAKAPGAAAPNVSPPRASCKDASFELCAPARCSASPACRAWASSICSSAASAWPI